MTFLQQEIPQREKDYTEAAPATMPAKVPGSADQDRAVSQGEQVPRWAGESQEGVQAEGIAPQRGLCFTGSSAGRSGMQPQSVRSFGRSEGVKHWDGDGTWLHSSLHHETASWSGSVQ